MIAKISMLIFLPFKALFHVVLGFFTVIICSSKYGILSMQQIYLILIEPETSKTNVNMIYNFLLSRKMFMAWFNIATF